MYDRSLLSVCGNNYTPDYVHINGTIFVTCVKGKSKDIALGLGLVFGILFLFLICVCTIICIKPVKQQPNFIEFTTSTNNKNHHVITVHNLRRWETFIHDGGYIRRIAQLLESEDIIPLELEGYFKEFHGELWNEVNLEGYDFVQRAAKLIRILFEEQSKLEKKSLKDTLDQWADKLVDRSGCEFGHKIIAMVRKQCM